LERQSWQPVTAAPSPARPPPACPSATLYSTQEDPIGLAGGLNLYGYAGADPVNYTDPFGLELKPIDARAEKALLRIRAYAAEASASSDSATAAGGAQLQAMLTALDEYEGVILVGSSSFRGSGFGKLLDDAGNPTGGFGVRLGRRHLKHSDATLLTHELGHAYHTVSTGSYGGVPGPSNTTAVQMENHYRSIRGCGTRRAHDSLIPFGLSIPSCH
jgi:hypothetical protein